MSSVLEDKQFLYIIGSPRSGTTMLQILLASHPQVASTVEQTLFQLYVAPWLEAWKMEVANLEQRGWKLGLPILWKESELEEVLRAFLTRAYEKILALKPAATHLLDKHPGYSLHVRTIRRFLPRARFIHLIRDGRDVAASSLAVHGKMGFGPGKLSKAAAKWRRFVLAAREAREFGPDYLEVRYEDFLGGKTDAYTRVLTFCGLDGSPAWIAETIAANSFDKMKGRGASPDPNVPLSEKRYHRGQAGGWREDLSPMDRYNFEQIAGDLLRELGYAEEGWWAESASDRVLLPLRSALARRQPAIAQFCAAAHTMLRGPQS
jgi:hypothetical protein